MFRADLRDARPYITAWPLVKNREHPHSTAGMLPVVVRSFRLRFARREDDTKQGAESRKLTTEG